MSLSLASSLLLAASLAAQVPSGHSERPLSAEEVAKLEAKHLQNIRQVTFGFFRAGEGYFRPDGRAIIFQAVPNLPTIGLPHAQAQPGRIPDLHRRPRPGREAPRWSAPARGMHLRVLPSRRQVDPLRLDPPEPQPPGARATAYLQPDRALPLGVPRRDGHLPGRPRRHEPRPPDRHARLRRRGELLARRQADHLHLVPRRRRRDLHHGRRRQERRGGSPAPRATTAARSSRPTASGSSTAATARRTTCSRSTSTTPTGRPSEHLTSNEFVNWGPFFHPDSRHIVYSTSRHGHQNYELYLMDVDTGAEERITYHDGFDGLPGLQPRRQEADVDLERPAPPTNEPALHRRLHPRPRAPNSLGAVTSRALRDVSFLLLTPNDTRNDDA